MFTLTDIDSYIKTINDKVLPKSNLGDATRLPGLLTLSSMKPHSQKHSPKRVLSANKDVRYLTLSSQYCCIF